MYKKLEKESNYGTSVRYVTTIVPVSPNQQMFQSDPQVFAAYQQPRAYQPQPPNSRNYSKFADASGLPSYDSVVNCAHHIN